VAGTDGRRDNDRRGFGSWGWRTADVHARGGAEVRALRRSECQLMPNLINAVKPAERDAPASDAARVAAVRAALDKGGDAEGMEWGTVLVFTCADDCCEGAGLFAEEEVLVQWDE
jgi:hypothetical protein